MIFGITQSDCPRTRSEEPIMSKIVVDASLRSLLQAVNQPVDLCDESGQVLGRFLPAVDLSRYEVVEPPISDEELDRLSRSNEKTYTTAEVLAYLEKL
jgi:hypothetical protein